MTGSTGVVFVIVGAALVFIGVLALVGGLAWFGRLPGDIHMASGNVRLFAPLVSMVVVSVVLTLILNILVRLL